MHAFTVGFLACFSLILAIGAQNAFVLKQGIKRQHVFVVCLLCSVFDLLLFALGAAGFAVLVKQFPWMTDAARYGGALFLVFYGINSLYAALKKSDSLRPAQQGEDDLVKTLLICLAFTFLNPHVYLDTVVFMGSLSTQFEGDEVAFVMGASLASFIFFFSLGYGARLLTPVFEKPVAWKILDASVGILMICLAISLLVFIE